MIKAYEIRNQHNPQMIWPIEILTIETRECEKVCYRAMERAERKGYIEYGVSLRSAWITDKGKELLTKN